MTYRAKENRLKEGDFFPLARRPEPLLYGWPPNLAHDTAPHEALLPKLAKENADALVFATKGEELDADLTVSVGHSHDSIPSARRWRGIGSWPLTTDIAGSNREGDKVTETSITSLGWYLFDVEESLQDYIIVRLRASLPSPGTAIHTTLQVRGDLYDSGLGIIADHWFSFGLQSSSARSFSDEWLELPRRSVRAVGASGGKVSCVLHLRAYVIATGAGTLWELALGHYEG